MAGEPQLTGPRVHDAGAVGGGLPGPEVVVVGVPVLPSRIEFRNDKTGVIHAPIGKASFAPEKIADNLRAFLKAVEGVRPESSKRTFLRSVFITTTMGPSIKVNPHA